MAIVEWDPMRELRVMQEQMNRLLEMSRERVGKEELAPTVWQPPVDIYEDDREVVVKMEVPEVAQEDIQVQVEEGTLLIAGERKLEREEARHNYHRIERVYGPFRRSFSLPASVDQEAIVARCDRGVLKVVLPKKGAAGTPRQIEVEVR